MGFFGFIVFCSASLALWIVFWKAYYRVRDAQDEVHFATTSDGWRLAVSRFKAAPGAPSRRLPVVLCPGVGANRHSFHLSAETSLARFLAARGFDCWVMELRGSGLSERPNPFLDTHYGWSLDDHIQKDVPAAIDKVRAVTGAPQVHFVGHSMGGIVLYLSLILLGGERFRSGVTIGSSLDYCATGSDFDQLIKLKWLVSWLPAVPMGALASALAPLTGRFPNLADEFMYRAANTDRLLYRRLIANGYQAVSGPVFWQLETGFTQGGIRSADRSVAYSEKLGSVRTPVYVIAGGADRQCAISAAKRTFDALGSSDKRFSEYEGHAHFDLLIGRDAHRTIFPGIAEWIERLDRSPGA